MNRKAHKKTSPAIFVMAAAAVGLLLASTAQAVPTITFDDGAGFQTEFTWDGVNGHTSNTVVVTILNINGIDTPANTGTISCFACELTFTTGPISYDGTNYHFGSGGSYEITGRVPALDIAWSGGLPDGDEAVLLSGDFLPGANFARVGPQDFWFAAGPDEKNQTLVDYFYGEGANNLFDFGHSNIAGRFVHDSTTGAFDFTISQTDVINQQIPEPTTTVVFLLGLSGLAVFSRRRRG